MKMIDSNWIEDLLNKSKENTIKENKQNTNPLENELIKKIINDCYSLHQQDTTKPLGRLLASAFDLLVSADYYSSVAHKGWFYCGVPTPNLYFHYTNCCPRHALENIFHFHQSSKPESGSIGKSTSRLLRNFLSELLVKNNKSEFILKGSEPVDIVIVNEKTHHILFGEIKASPLVTIPLILDSEEIKSEDADVSTEHFSGETITVSKIFNQQFYLFLPIKKGSIWTDSKVKFGKKEDATDKFWGYRSMINLLNVNADFLSQYFEFWNEALNKYHPRMTENVFWLTNGCGAPNPRPDTWPRAKNGLGEGYESISDSKTSVGMDRTDDIKKGIYQVLKLGSEGKSVTSKWKFKVGIVSNIHAARHFDEYLDSLINLIWTHDKTGKAVVAGDLDKEHPMFNLFDAIISLSQSHFRDEWLKETFEFK
jgi:hypothetical protein